MDKEKQLREQANEHIQRNKWKQQEDPYRLVFHHIPPVGLLNDPNGLIQFQGRYHVFYQWNPFETEHGAKFWGHVSSPNLIEWEEHPPALVPSEWYEKNGCYSGSAIEHNHQLYLFYTGNVKNEKGERETYQCLAVSSDGIHFEKKGPVLHLPKGYTSHFRDPKVWKEDHDWYMVVGAQNEQLQGCAVLFKSTDLYRWEYKGPIAGSGLNGLESFGFMWECPDFFPLDGNDILLVSPQGIDKAGYLYWNVYQSGFFIGEWDREQNDFSHGPFRELDRGFDFYAPQTFMDHEGRRIMYAWMGMPNEEEIQPSVKYGWVHALTLPRELSIVKGHLYQKPIRELQKLREDKWEQLNIEMNNEVIHFNQFAKHPFECLLSIEEMNGNRLVINIQNEVWVSYETENQLFSVNRRKLSNPNEKESRHCLLDERLSTLHIFVDQSSIEIFINEGKEVFTLRMYPDLNEKDISIKSEGEVKFHLTKWNLKGFLYNE